MPCSAAPLCSCQQCRAAPRRDALCRAVVFMLAGQQYGRPKWYPNIGLPAYVHNTTRPHCAPVYPPPPGVPHAMSTMGAQRGTRRKGVPHPPLLSHH